MYGVIELSTSGCFPLTRPPPHHLATSSSPAYTMNSANKIFGKSHVIKTEPLENKDAKWATLIKTTYTDPEGVERTWESGERLTRPKGTDIDGVGVAAILQDPAKPNDEPRIILQKQWRPPVNATVIEVPAGLMDPNESPETCAIRELKEETGYIGELVKDQSFQVSPVMFNDPGFCNTNLRMIHVTVDLSRPENQNPQPELEENEFIETFSVPLKDLWDECIRFEKEGYAIDARLFTIAYLISIFVLRDNGMGFSGKVLTLDQMVNQIRATLVIEIIYYCIINSIKISILLFYLRIGHCIHSTAFFYMTSSTHILIDIWILLLPITTILKVRRPRREKLALIGVFSLGIFSCIASIARLHSIRIYTESDDPFYDCVPLNLWSMVEVNVGILCASIPTTKPLFNKAQREGSRKDSYECHSRDHSAVKSCGNDNDNCSHHKDAANGPIGVVFQNDSYGLKQVQSGQVQRLDATPENGGNKAWRMPDSDVDERHAVWPESRV
ncbi:adp-ribose pyrophosphatase [Stemphylium lycopersici]|nr:adp-ribose pyrophosphatase [Stemphylium lycopersici]